MQKLITLKNSIYKTLAVIALILFCAWLFSRMYYRFDLTSEKRYTLSPFTKKTLKNLNDPVQIVIYLEGDLNIPFHKMRQRTRETMEEFEAYAGKQFRYEFINPFEGKDRKAIDAFLNELIEKGLRPTNIMDTDEEGGSAEKIIIPGALVRFKDNEVPVNFLKNNPGSSAEENINRSIESLEFELMRAITSLTADSTEKIAFIEGHGEFNEYQVADITNELGWSFQVDRGKLNGKPGILDQYQAVIIAGPTKPFPETDKYILDQYLMNGGKILWFVDMVNASIDSIGSGNPFLAMIRTLNIEDLFFRYGIRVNPVLLQDVHCSTIPVNVALAGNPPDFRPVPWLYSPLLNSPAGNVITRNLNMIKTEFTGSIDTLAARRDIRKTVLLRTSEFTKQVAVPAMISLDEVRLVPKQEEFNQQFLPVVVLLKGPFESAFRNRMLAGLFPDTVLQPIETGKISSILVSADADIIRNEISPSPRGIRYMPLGFDRYTSQTYGNKEFIVNAVQFMTGHTGLIELRSKKLTIRLLNKDKMKKDRSRWILVNTVFPPLLVMIAGFFYAWYRRRKYSIV